MPCAERAQASYPLSSGSKRVRGADRSLGSSQAQGQWCKVSRVPTFTGMPVAGAFPTTGRPSTPRLIGSIVMTNPDAALQALLSTLFRSQRFAVLATDDCGQPFTSLMAFAATDDLEQVVLLTERAGRKFINLVANRRVALLIDDRENKGSDTRDSVAVTALGEAQEADPEAGVALLQIFLARHPYLAELAASPTCAIVRVQINSYRVVSRFRDVVEWRVRVE